MTNELTLKASDISGRDNVPTMPLGRVVQSGRLSGFTTFFFFRSRGRCPRLPYLSLSGTMTNGLTLKASDISGRDKVPTCGRNPIKATLSQSDGFAKRVKYIICGPSVSNIPHRHLENLHNPPPPTHRSSLASRPLTGGRVSGRKGVSRWFDSGAVVALVLRINNPLDLRTANRTG